MQLIVIFFWSLVVVTLGISIRWGAMFALLFFLLSLSLGAEALAN